MGKVTKPTNQGATNPTIQKETPQQTKNNNPTTAKTPRPQNNEKQFQISIRNSKAPRSEEHNRQKHVERETEASPGTEAKEAKRICRQTQQELHTPNLKSSGPVTPTPRVLPLQETNPHWKTA